MEDKNENNVSTDIKVDETKAEDTEKTVTEEEKTVSDEVKPAAEVKEKAPVEEKLTAKERRERWKAAKKKRMQEQKEYYKYAPWPVRIWALYLKVPVIIILVICLITVFVYEPVYNFFIDLYEDSINTYYIENKDRELSEEDRARIYEMAPIDEKGSSIIDAFPAIGENETWTICVYMVGSDLEDQNEVDLAPVTSLKTNKIKQDNTEKQKRAIQEKLDRFEKELALEGLELPSYYYYPIKPVESSTYVTQDVVVESDTGCASLDIAEITSGIWSDNIRVVIQPCGATHWSNHRINPNRIQRFAYENGVLEEVSNEPLQPAYDPDTLAGFLKFCDMNYHSDHNMLVLWDHGGGPFGYGNDTIYGKDLSIKDIRSALEKAHGRNPSEAPYDIIGFDACMMSSIEVAHALNGYARYYCLSQEAEPGDGWNYGVVLQDMTDNPTMSVPQVARTVADAYIDYYMTENVNVGSLYTCSTTFSVLDAKKTEELYKAYSDLCKAQLKDAAKDMAVLANVGRCANASTRYGVDSSDIFNLVDLGNYVENMSQFYPAECEKVSKLVDEAVLYHRENGSVCDSTGISVYLPADVNDFYGLYYYIMYVYDVCEDDNARALYYYKQAGCLNEELSKYVEGIANVKPMPLDVKAFADYTKLEPVVEESGFSIPADEELRNLVVGYELVLSELDEVANTVTELGSIGGAALEDQRGFVSDFDGKWPTIDGTPMYVEIVSKTESATEYRAHVMYNGQEAYLMLNQDHQKNELNITGIRKVDDDNPNYMVNTKNLETLEENSTVVPLYLETNLSDGADYLIEGRKLTLKKNTKVKMETLPQGYYLGSIVISDTRGDSYYSAIVGANVDQNGIEDWCLDDRFVGTDY